MAGYVRTAMAVSEGGDGEVVGPGGLLEGGLHLARDVSGEVSQAVVDVALQVSVGPLGGGGFGVAEVAAEPFECVVQGEHGVTGPRAKLAVMKGGFNDFSPRNRPRSRAAWFQTWSGAPKSQRYRLCRRH